MPVEKRSLLQGLPGMTGLSLMNPWHAARTLFNPEVPNKLRYDQPETIEDNRQERSINDEIIPLSPDFVQSRISLGPMLKRNVDLENIMRSFDPKYLTYGKRSVINVVNKMLEESNSPQKKNMEIMRFGKRGI